MPEDLKQPPIGIIPQFLWVEQRVRALQDAILRYQEAGMAIPDEWLTEIISHYTFLRDRKHVKPTE